MVTQATLQKQIKAVNNAVRGTWVKMHGNWHTNAFEAIDTYTETPIKTYITTDTLSNYTISVTKDYGRYFVFAEDHEPEDILDHPEKGFKTLREAMEFAEDFGVYFETCWKECEGIEA